MVLVSYTISIVLSAAMICVGNLDESLIRRYVPAALRTALPALIRETSGLLDAHSTSSDNAAVRAVSSGAQEGGAIASDVSINLPREVALQVERLLMVLSFGLVSPFVAFVCGISSLMLWLKLMFLLFVYLDKHDTWQRSAAGQGSHALSTLCGACSGIDGCSLRSVWVMGSVASALLIGSLAVDIAADSDIPWDLSLLFLVAPLVLIVLLVVGEWLMRCIADPSGCASGALSKEGGSSCHGHAEEAKIVLTPPEQSMGRDSEIQLVVQCQVPL